MGRRDLLLWGVLLAGGSAVVGGSLRTPLAERAHAPIAVVPRTAIDEAAARVDDALARTWDERDVPPTTLATELTVLRRMTLALTGSVPSLEDVRRFEALPEMARREVALDRLLADRRTSDYLSERLARAFVGTEDGPFLMFRRRRFTTWLSDAIHENQRFDTTVRRLITETGLWTDHPATNFLTVTFDPEAGRPDPERLAARVARAFLGVRLDCAQCHDHPFAPWKQGDFRGLAAYFGAVRSDLRGLRDGQAAYQPIDRKTLEPVAIEPRVPFRSELEPADGTPRERLASWVVDARNPSLARATVNRMWALMLGRPLVDPVDDLPTDEAALPPALRILAEDFAANGFDLHRLVRVIAATQAFRRESAGSGDGPGPDQEAVWAAFPLTRLRPEQVAASVFQSASLATLTADSPWFIRFLRYTGSNDFVRRYGDTGEDEFAARGGTIPQRLLLLNGDLVRDQTKEGLLSASSQIAEMAADDARAIETAYLTVLTRRPTAEEAEHFAGRLKGSTGDPRKQRLSDLFWTLLNTTEFSWNH